jgi:ribulose-phosphate 3-epimerase
LWCLLLNLLCRHFVPNITIGPPVIKSLRQHTNAYLDCHCMVSNPGQWVADFKDAGASQITFHIEAVESDESLAALITQIKEAGMDVGVAIKPKTGEIHFWAALLIYLCVQVSMKQ